MNHNIDIYSEDFFAADPFGDDDSDMYGFDKFQKMSLELYTVEEQSSYSNGCASETSESSLEPQFVSSAFLKPVDGEIRSNISTTSAADFENKDAGPKHLEYHISEGVENGRIDDCITDSTCKSTSYQSTESTYQHNLNVPSPRSHLHLANQTQSLQQCGNLTCATQRHIMGQQEEQICFLRRMLQEYADLCARHNIGQDLLAKKDSAVPSTCSAGSGRTNYTPTPKTYSDLLGPWDIPFHVEVSTNGGSPDNDDYSGITFAQHPSKAKEPVHRIRHCTTDDDDALPVIRPSHGRSNPVTPDRIRRTRKANVKERKTEIFRLPVPPSEDNHAHDDRAGPAPPQTSSVRKMPVVIERKYGRQKALYSGTIDPESRCPHGVGTLQFFKSGDIYIGEIAFGEMHGYGTYVHHKTSKTFRGHFERNSFVGGNFGSTTSQVRT